MKSFNLLYTVMTISESFQYKSQRQQQCNSREAFKTIKTDLKIPRTHLEAPHFQKAYVTGTFTDYQV